MTNVMTYNPKEAPRLKALQDEEEHLVPLVAQLGRVRTEMMEIMKRTKQAKSEKKLKELDEAEYKDYLRVKRWLDVLEQEGFRAHPRPLPDDMLTQPEERQELWRMRSSLKAARTMKAARDVNIAARRKAEEMQKLKADFEQKLQKQEQKIRELEAASALGKSGGA